MTPEQIEATQDKVYLSSNSPEFWLSEICLQLAGLRQEMGEVRRLLKADHKPTPQKKHMRTFYAVEHVPSLPVQIDSISRDIPKTSTYHIVRGHTKAEALEKLVAKLTKERQSSQE